PMTPSARMASHSVPGGGASEDLATTASSTSGTTATIWLHATYSSAWTFLRARFEYSQKADQLKTLASAGRAPARVHELLSEAPMEVRAIPTRDAPSSRKSDRRTRSPNQRAAPSVISMVVVDWMTLAVVTVVIRKAAKLRPMSVATISPPISEAAM